jgi:hypothetical protein
VNRPLTILFFKRTFNNEASKRGLVPTSKQRSEDKISVNVVKNLLDPNKFVFRLISFSTTQGTFKLNAKFCKPLLVYRSVWLPQTTSAEVFLEDFVAEPGVLKKLLTLLLKISSEDSQLTGDQSLTILSKGLPIL